MSSASPPETASFPYPTQIVYDGRADEVRAAVDVAPVALEDVTVEVGARRLRIGVASDDADDDTNDDAERTVTPLPRELVFGDDREAVYNNGVLSVTLETVERWR
ncbi:Hsp20/alpha crystallin family protein [Natrinema soli]|uniref:Hsp20/alpha crystallin family protein n=1 Tax=Natrinema soli TaxID=1930624 RepID=A0ABD5SX74_9EURY|nr:Hsp20/alpha crystallin family protein [Natrinema soli]